MDFYSSGFDSGKGDNVFGNAVTKFEERAIEAGRHIHPFQFFTLIKHIVVKLGNTVRDSDLGQAFTLGECRKFNAGNTVRDVNAGQTITPPECRIPNTGNTVRNVHGCQVFAIAECALSDIGKAI